MLATYLPTTTCYSYPFPTNHVKRSYPRQIPSLLSHKLQSMAKKRFGAVVSIDDELRAYVLPIVEVYRYAARNNPSININKEVMAGAPCVAGTRIPIYMILDALEHYGTVEGVKTSYPRLTDEQIKAALRFAKTVVECPFGDEAGSNY